MPSLTPNNVGSKADLPKDLLAQIEDLESMFMVRADKLKEITDHLITELDKGEYSGSRHTLGLADSADRHDC